MKRTCLHINTTCPAFTGDTDEKTACEFHPDKIWLKEKMSNPKGFQHVNSFVRMKRRNTVKLLIMLLIVTSLLSSCLKIGEYYVGLHMQPNMDDSPFEPGINLFGVLKTGPDFDTINHRFEIQHLLDLADWSEGFEVKDAEITLTRKTQLGKVIVYNPVYRQDGLYFDKNIETAPGDEWQLVCVKDTFVVTSNTTIPDKPVFVESKIQRNNKSISFEVLTDSTAFMYLVYLMNGKNFVADQKIANHSGNTYFNLGTTWDIGGEVTIFVFAYDKEMREYYTSSNTFFKPNAFRPGFSVVDGGFGVFGSVSSNVLVME